MGDGLNVAHRNIWLLKSPATHCWPSIPKPNTAFFPYWLLSWPLAFTDSERKKVGMGGRMLSPLLLQGAPLAHSHSPSHFLTCCIRLWFVCNWRLVSLATEACQDLRICSPLQWQNAAIEAKEGSWEPQWLKELFCRHDVSFSRLNCHRYCK